MNTIGNHQDAIIKTHRSKTSLKKGDECFEHYLVTEVGHNRIIGIEDREGNDVWDKLRKLEKEGWAYLPSGTKWNVGDPVKVHAPDEHKEFYLLGRITYIDTEINGTKEFGVLYYGRNNKELLELHVPEDRVIALKTLPYPNPGQLVSHSITMDYVDEAVKNEDTNVPKHNHLHQHS